MVHSVSGAASGTGQLNLEEVEDDGSDGEGGGSDDEGDGSDDEEDDSDDKEDDSEGGDEQTEVSRTPFATHCTMFRKWIMSFVGHFSAQRTLEKHASDLPPDEEVHLDLFTMPRCDVKIGSWADMEDLIQEIAKHHDTDYIMTAKTYINRVKKHLAADPKNRTAEQSKIFTIFTQLIDNVAAVQFPGDKHCEAILAAFLAYYLDIASLEDENYPKLQELYGVLDPLTFEV